MNKQGLILLMAGLFLIAGCTSPDRNKDQAKKLPDFPTQPVNYWEVKVTDDFWAPRMETNRLVTIPYLFA